MVLIGLEEVMLKLWHKDLVAALRVVPGEANLIVLDDAGIESVKTFLQVELVVVLLLRSVVACVQRLWHHAGRHQVR